MPEEGEEEPECLPELPVELYLSPDDSNSMASAVLARHHVLDSGYTKSQIRTHEFFNYYSFDYASADDGELAVTLDLVGDPDDPSSYQLQVGIASESRTKDERDPMNLTLVVDTSCSMEGAPIELTRDVCREVAGQLKGGDLVNMVTWDSEQEMWLQNHVVDGAHDPALVAVCDGLTNGGGTNLSAGLQAGYALASDAASDDRIDRMLLISDGGANLGITDEELIADKAQDLNHGGIYMAGAGVGEAGSYNDVLMNVVTDAGKGAAVFLPDSEEVAKVFGDDFVNTMDVAARNVELKLELPGGFEIARFSAEEISTDRREVEPQHLAPNDTMVFYNQLWTCAPEEVTGASEIIATVTWQDVRTGELQSITQTASFTELLASDTSRLKKGAAVFAYAEALKAIQSGSDKAEQALDKAKELVLQAEEVYPSDADLLEIGTVLWEL
jgi:Ca-activated chloride channel family protein